MKKKLICISMFLCFAFLFLVTPTKAQAYYEIDDIKVKLSRFHPGSPIPSEADFRAYGNNELLELLRYTCEMYDSNTSTWKTPDSSNILADTSYRLTFLYRSSDSSHIFAGSTDGNRRPYTGNISYYWNSDDEMSDFIITSTPVAYGPLYSDSNFARCLKVIVTMKPVAAYIEYFDLSIPVPAEGNSPAKVSNITATPIFYYTNNKVKPTITAKSCSWEEYNSSTKTWSKMSTSTFKGGKKYRIKLTLTADDGAVGFLGMKSGQKTEYMGDLKLNNAYLTSDGNFYGSDEDSCYVYGSGNGSNTNTLVLTYAFPALHQVKVSKTSDSVTLKPNTSYKMPLKITIDGTAAKTYIANHKSEKWEVKVSDNSTNLTTAWDSKNGAVTVTDTKGTPRTESLTVKLKFYQDTTKLVKTISVTMNCKVIYHTTPNFDLFSSGIKYNKTKKQFELSIRNLCKYDLVFAKGTAFSVKYSSSKTLKVKSTVKQTVAPGKKKTLVFKYVSGKYSANTCKARITLPFTANGKKYSIITKPDIIEKDDVEYGVMNIYIKSGTSTKYLTRQYCDYCDYGG